MMEFMIEREKGNQAVTKGWLSVSGTNFAACTLEAKDPTHATSSNKALLALPDGIYRLKLFYERTGYTLRFLLNGTYHHARFEQGEEPADVAAGSIILGTGFDGDFKIKGSEEAMKKFGAFLDFLLGQQRFGEKNSDITLTIRHAPDYVYKQIAMPVPQAFDVTDGDWNVIDDEMNVEPSK